MSSEDAAATGAAWRRVVGWCADRAPVTARALNGPADDAKLAAVQQELGHVWPDDLVSWLGVSDGAKRDLAARVIPPLFIPLSLSRMQVTWQMLTSIRTSPIPAEVATLEAEVAGSPSPYFLRQWVPIAEDTCGDFLFVDLRGGDRHCAVYEFWRDDAFHGLGSFWPTVRHMATSIADALEGGLWAPDDMEPTLTHGAMEWGAHRADPQR